jgi:hypothetical protein
MVKLAASLADGGLVKLHGAGDGFSASGGSSTSGISATCSLIHSTLKSTVCEQLSSGLPSQTLSSDTFS